MALIESLVARSSWNSEPIHATSFVEFSHNPSTIVSNKVSKRLNTVMQCIRLPIRKILNVHSSLRSRWDLLATWTRSIRVNRLAIDYALVDFSRRCIDANTKQNRNDC